VSRHLVTIAAQSDADLDAIYALSRPPFDDETLKGQGVALLFERPSLRTRASSSAAVHELGGFATFFSEEEIGFGTRESVEDIGRTLAQLYAIAAMRVRDHRVFERIHEATNGAMSLVNLLSDLAHPTQAIADVLTLADHFAQGRLDGLSGLRVAYVGDATNVARSLAVALLRLGVDVTIGAPPGYGLGDGQEDPREVRGGGDLRLVATAADAVADADAVYTDSWVSMGVEHEAEARRAAFAAFRVDAALMAGAQPDAVVLHCLPAHRGDEISDDVLDGPASLAWQQVFHRRSAMRGVLRWIKEDPG
jgi:ornithine carbamoyltransferase